MKEVAGATMKSNRTNWQVIRSVWYALFLREMIGKTSAGRLAWFWLVFEPFAMVTILVSIRSLISGGRFIGGVDFIPWVVTGLFGFYLFRENLLKSLGAISANKALFTYRQVKPVDPVLVRCMLEGTIRGFVFVLFILCAQLLDINIIPHYIIKALSIWLLIWLLATGFGLTFSALSALVPEIGRIVKLTSLPLLIISGVMVPIQLIPESAQNILLFNPILHGLELLRLAFFENYKTVDKISLLYITFWALSINLLGLLLHIRFSMKLKTQ